ncbi:MAG TPA: glucan 1,4-alpha-glucosidase [bacterium]|nr:glucan 1,4-alpha-glucosidase [bacterium]
MDDPATQAPGWPGSPARWTSSAKTGVGTALSFASRIWFTLSHGILNEVYWPRQDRACTRDMGLIVTDGHTFFSEEKRHTRSEVFRAAPGVPAYRVVNTCLNGRYRIEKDIIADPARDSVLQRTRFVPLTGSVQDYHLYVLLAPHLSNHGGGNTAWTDAFKGAPMLFAERDGSALALGCSAPWRARSVGFVGVSDGWQDLVRNKHLTWAYPRAENGNVALVAEIDLQAADGECVLALGFGADAAEAGHRVIASLLDGFEPAKDTYVRRWQEWQRSLTKAPGRGAPSAPIEAGKDVYRTSAAVLRTHESKTFPGGMIASLSIPWGFAQEDGDLGGYHLVWPRDLVESASGLLAAGGIQDVRRVLHYLRVTQEEDGHWPQNMWLDGSPYWGGVQMDETALPILLVDLLRRGGHLDAIGVQRYWPMVRNAAGFVVRNGPVTQQDRWEEDPGYSPFTLAAEIAGLLAAADLAELNGDAAVACYLRETADIWNANVERWTYVANTDLARRLDVRGYYVRIAPPDVAESASRDGFVPIKNRPPGSSAAPASQLISPDALALVRFGLRAPDDPRIVDTVRVIDALLKVDTPAGPAWHRYNGDGYGEHEDGRAFDGTGVGRAWPLLTGERAHYELAAGHREVAEQLLRTMEAFASDSGLIPEQVWDGPDLPARELFFGRPSGSAMPLVWAHAEYIKLHRSIADGRVFDMPPQAAARYRAGRETAGGRYTPWRFNNKSRALAAGTTLRVETLAPAVVHWSDDAWRTVRDSASQDTGLGVHVADIPTAALARGADVRFTFYWPQAARWEGVDFTVIVE